MKSGIGMDPAVILSVDGSYFINKNNLLSSEIPTREAAQKFKARKAQPTDGR